MKRPCSRCHRVFDFKRDKYCPPCRAAYMRAYRARRKEAK